MARRDHQLRPHVTLKAALTLDGRLATRRGHSMWITGEAARREAHRLRADSDAVLVGSGTVLADDPALTVRLVRGRNPLRVVLDTGLRTPPACKLLDDTSRTPTLIFHGRDAGSRRESRLVEAGAELCAVRRLKRGLSLPQVLAELSRRGVERLLVEGGARVHGAFLDAGLADAAAIFIAPRILADAEALPFAIGRPRRRMDEAIQLTGVVRRNLGDDTLIRGDIRR